jgi:metallo-beta-lactamase class B
LDTLNFAIKTAFFSLLLSLTLSVAATAQPSLEEMAKDPPVLLSYARKALGWEEAVKPFQIVGPVYYVGTRGLGVFLISTNDGLIVINTGMPGSGPMIAASIRHLGFDPRDIKLLLAGHAHLDHVGATAYLKKLSGADIAMIEEEAELFESGGRLDFHTSPYREFDFEGMKVDRVFKDGDVLELGEIALTALLTNGHTPGSTTFVTEVMHQGKTYAVAFPNGLGVNPGYRLEVHPSYAGIADNYRRTFRVLGALRPDIWLGAHSDFYHFEEKLARSASEGVAAWVDPEGYQRWLTKQQSHFDEEIETERDDTR